MTHEEEEDYKRWQKLTCVFCHMVLMRHNFTGCQLLWMVVGKKHPEEFWQNVGSASGGKMMKGVLQPGVHDFGNMFQDFTSLQMSKVCVFPIWPAYGWPTPSRCPRLKEFWHWSLLLEDDPLKYLLWCKTGNNIKLIKSCAITYFRLASCKFSKAVGRCQHTMTCPGANICSWVQKNDFTQPRWLWKSKQES